MVLGKLAGASCNLGDSRAMAYCACSRYGWGLFGHFYSHLSFLFSFSFSLGDGPIYYLKGPLSPKQPTNQYNTLQISFSSVFGSHGSPDMADG